MIDGLINYQNLREKGSSHHPHSHLLLVRFRNARCRFWGSLYGYQLLAEAKSPPKIVNKKVEVAYVLWRMARPTHLRLIAFVYLLGATMAMALGAAFDAQLLVFGLVVLLLVSSSVHYANEYADYETDALTQRTLFSGGSGALPGSTVPRRVALLTGAIGFPVAAAYAPFVALVFLNLLATTWPDREADVAVGKRMLATSWSPVRLRRLYWAVAALFFLMFPLLVSWSIHPGLLGPATWSHHWSFSVDTSTQNLAHRFLRLQR